MPRPDIVVTNHGTIFTFELRTAAAREWVAEHVDPEATYFGGALVVEHRYARDIAEGMLSDGLEVQ